MSSTTVNLRDILEIIDHIAPFSLAEEWDNVGLMVGDPGQKISALLVGLDPTLHLLQEASETGANLVVTHHPIIFSPLKNIRTDRPSGAFIAEAITSRIAVVGCHTNLDVVKNGVSHTLAKSLGLTDLETLVPTAADNKNIGFGQTGSLTQPLAAQDFVDSLCAALELAAVKIAGPLPATIKKAAVCGGSGSDFAEAAFKAGAQVFITGEVKHSTARWAEEIGFCIIDAGHYATENLITGQLALLLEKEFAVQGIDIPVHRTVKQKNPFFFFFPQEKKSNN